MPGSHAAVGIRTVCRRRMCTECVRVVFYDVLYMIIYFIQGNFCTKALLTVFTPCQKQFQIPGAASCASGWPFHCIDGCLVMPPACTQPTLATSTSAQLCCSDRRSPVWCRMSSHHTCGGTCVASHHALDITCVASRVWRHACGKARPRVTPRRCILNGLLCDDGGVAHCRQSSRNRQPVSPCD